MRLRMNANAPDGLTHLIEAVLRCRDNIQIFVRCQIFSPGFQSDFHKPFFFHRVPGDGDQTFASKHIRDRAGRCQMALVLAKNTPNIRCCSIFVVRSRLDDDRSPSGAISFVDQFFKYASRDLSGSLFDRPLDRIVWHILSTCRYHGGSKPGIYIQVASPGSGSHHYFFRIPAEYLAALGVQRTFKALDLRPFTMPRHTPGEKTESEKGVKIILATHLRPMDKTEVFQKERTANERINKRYLRRKTQLD